MSTASSPNITVTFDDNAMARPLTDQGSFDSIDEDPNHPEHKQDWSRTTDEKDSWANKERRRSTVWSKIDTNAPTVTSSSTAPAQRKSSSAGGRERRGSVLSIWHAGKDKEGNHVLAHDSSGEEDNESAVTDERRSSLGSGEEVQKRSAERRGSILSTWSTGKDHTGRPVIRHDDEEWKA